MKAVMISIHPKWCDLIANGKKTLEVRKTKPGLETPFKVYIYCTQDKNVVFANHNNWRGNGLVIGEFVCDVIRVENEIADHLVDVGLMRHSCLSSEELLRYADGKVLYSWHISDLKIYDEPKALCEFYKDCDNANCDDCPYLHFENTPDSYEGWCEYDERLPIKRPPQSWCYVEEV